MYFLGRCFFSVVLVIVSQNIQAGEALELGPMPISLKHLPVPEVPGLLNGDDPIVKNKKQAIALGKALFWDINVGSDGIACASCHFHAGADRRHKNQLAPTGQSATSEQHNLAEFPVNHTLQLNDYPFFQTKDPFQENSDIVNNKKFVTGSSGAFGGQYKQSTKNKSYDDCTRKADTIFHIGAVGTRKVTPRNAPTVINAIFNHRNFWDGRANTIFNGSSPWGDRDTNAGVWVVQTDKRIAKQRLHLKNASLASLATAPPLNSTEMSCANRSLADIARKLLSRKALEKQKIHWNDSVLSDFSVSTSDELKPGLSMRYEQLIKKSFHKKYWSYEETGQFGHPLVGAPYRQIEANFGLFFGLAIQLYIGTLVSDESPFDLSRRDVNHQPIDLTASELNGLKQFRLNLCGNCHLGPNFTAAAVNANTALGKTHRYVFDHPNATANVVKRIPVLIQNMPVTVFADTGFSSSGVSSENDDIGLAGSDIFGNPLSFSEQYLHYLAGNNAAVKDDAVRRVRACDFPEPFAVNFTPPYLANSLFTIDDGVQEQPQPTNDCILNPEKNAFIPTVEAARKELAKADSKKMLAKVKASFKIPSLRNIELTGPYMHNGSMATLEQVLEFYARGGNFNHDAKEITQVFPLPQLKFSEKNRKDLIAFLKTLTDERVRYQKAPFDHPELLIPMGHSGTQAKLVARTMPPNLAQDEFLSIPAVGASGSNTPLKPYSHYLAEYSN